MPDITYGMDENPKGDYVLWKDYKKLQAENERLRKAGDVMAKNLSHINWNICVEEWNAAKEGKQS